MKKIVYKIPDDRTNKWNYLLFCFKYYTVYAIVCFIIVLHFIC